MIEPGFLVEFLIVALDAPAQLGGIRQRCDGASGGNVESQYFVGAVSPSEPFAENPPTE